MVCIDWYILNIKEWERGYNDYKYVKTISS